MVCDMQAASEAGGQIEVTARDRSISVPLAPFPSPTYALEIVDGVARRTPSSDAQTLVCSSSGFTNECCVHAAQPPFDAFNFDDANSLFQSTEVFVETANGEVTLMQYDGFSVEEDVFIAEPRGADSFSTPASFW